MGECKEKQDFIKEHKFRRLLKWCSKKKKNRVILYLILNEYKHEICYLYNTRQCYMRVDDILQHNRQYLSENDFKSIFLELDEISCNFTCTSHTCKYILRQNISTGFLCSLFISLYSAHDKGIAGLNENCSLHENFTERTECFNKHMNDTLCKIKKNARFGFKLGEIRTEISGIRYDKVNWNLNKEKDNINEKDISSYENSDYSTVAKQNKKSKPRLWQKKKKKKSHCLGKSNFSISILNLGHAKLDCKSHNDETEISSLNPLSQNKRKKLTFKTLKKKVFKHINAEGKAKVDYDFDGTAQLNIKTTGQYQDSIDQGVSIQSPIVTSGSAVQFHQGFCSNYDRDDKFKSVQFKTTKNLIGLETKESNLNYKKNCLPYSSASVTVHVEKVKEFDQSVILESGPLCCYREQQHESDEITPQSSRYQEGSIIKCSSSIESLLRLDGCLSEKSTIDDEEISILREEHTDISSCHTCEAIISLQRNLPPDSYHYPVNSDSSSNVNLTGSSLPSTNSEYEEGGSANSDISVSDDSLKDFENVSACSESIFQNVHPNQDQETNECKTSDADVNGANFDKVSETVENNDIHMIYDSKNCLDHKCATFSRDKRKYADIEINPKDKEAHANDKYRKTAVNEIALDLDKEKHKIQILALTEGVSKETNAHTKNCEFEETDLNVIHVDKEQELNITLKKAAVREKDKGLIDNKLDVAADVIVTGKGVNKDKIDGGNGARKITVSNGDIYKEADLNKNNNNFNSTEIFTTRVDTIQVKVDEGTDFSKEDINEDNNTELKVAEEIEQKECMSDVKSGTSEAGTLEEENGKRHTENLKDENVEKLKKGIFPSFLMFRSTWSNDTHPDCSLYITSKICGKNWQQKYLGIESCACCPQFIRNSSCLLQRNGNNYNHFYSIHQTGKEKCKIWDANNVYMYNKTIREAVEKQIAREKETAINQHLNDGIKTDENQFEPSFKDMDNKGQIRLGHTSISINLDLEEFMRYMNSSTKPHYTNKEMCQRLKQLLRKLVVKTKIKSAKSCGTSKKKRIYKHTKRLTIEQLMRKFFNEMNAQFPNKGMDPSTKSLYDQIFKYLPFKHEQKLQVYPIHGLKQYFEQMSVPVSSRPAHAETMKFEWVRVRSFWSFPSNIRVSPIAMARVGFYYTGKCAECRCFCCGKVYREWRDGDDPYLIHQQISANCFYLNGMESGNVPIHEEDRIKPRHLVEQTLYSANAPADNAQAGALPGLNHSELSQIPVPQIPVAQERPFGSSQSGDFTFRPPESTQSGPVSQQTVINPPLPGYFAQTQQTSQNANQPTPASLSSVQQGSTPVQNVPSTPQGSGPSSLQNQPAIQTSITVGEQSREESRQPSAGSGTVAGSQESASATVSTGPSIQPPATATTTSGNTSTTSSSTSQPPPATTTTSTTGTTGSSSSSTAVTEPSRSRFDPLGINFEKPRYPAYAVLTVRINTYNGWPNYLDQTPRVMATAGFFYAGYGDYTRCFFCGGGLRNWEAGDDPWVEHARWFPKCAFLRQNKGDNYVRMVQTRHQEAEASNQPIQLPRQLSVLDEGRPANIMSSIPVQTLREMGKDDTIINQAIDRWRSNRQQTGRTLDNAELQATEIYEVILQIEEEREQGASALPTSRQQLALTHPTNQVVPQTSVAITEETTEQPTGAEGTTDDLSYLEGFEKVLEEYEEQKDKLTCTICMENPVAIAFLPCGHLVCCLDCAPAMRKCPICNEIVKGTIKTFFP